MLLVVAFILLSSQEVLHAYMIKKWSPNGPWKHSAEENHLINAAAFFYGDKILFFFSSFHKHLKLTSKKKYKNYIYLQIVKENNNYSMWTAPISPSSCLNVAIVCEMVMHQLWCSIILMVCQVEDLLSVWSDKNGQTEFNISHFRCLQVLLSRFIFSSFSNQFLVFDFCFFPFKISTRIFALSHFSCFIPLYFHSFTWFESRIPCSWFPSCFWFQVCNSVFFFCEFVVIWPCLASFYVLCIFFFRFCFCELSV